MLASALNRADVVLVDTRDTDDITARGGAAAGHINIPWSSFELYESRIRYLHSIFSSKDTPIVLYADPEAAQSAVLFKDALEQRCEYTNVQSCESADDLVAAKPSINLTSQPNLISNFVDATEIRVLYDQGAVLIDSRDPDEIEREKDSPQGHVNIPWSTFGHYSSKLNAFGDKLLGSNDKGKDSPVLVFCMRGRRAMFFKEALEKQCGFTNVFNCQNPGRVHPALPEVPLTATPHTMPEHLSVAEIASFGTSQSLRIIDAREPEEIESDKNAIKTHINIPWSGLSRDSSRLVEFNSLIGPKAMLTVVYCVNGRRAAALKEKLMLQCGFENVFSCENSSRILSAFPGIGLTGESAPLSPYTSTQELKQLFEKNSILVDVREPEEIAAHGAFGGHVNIPWSSFDEYLSRLSQLESVLGERSTPIVVYCANGRRAGMFKDALQKRCGYTRVFNGESMSRISTAAPHLGSCARANAISTFPSAKEIVEVFNHNVHKTMLVVDCREEDEIIQSGDAVGSHVNIPWSTFYSKAAAYFRAVSRGANSTIDGSTPIIIYCSKGWRSGHLLRFLNSCGYTNVLNCEKSTRIFDALPELRDAKTSTPVPFLYP